MKRTLIFLIAFVSLISVSAQKYTIKENLNYYLQSVQDTNDYIKERCVLDVYYPEDSVGFATIVWFHGGGLTGGSKYIPQGLKEKGICIVNVNYRLYPKVSVRLCIEDAAAAVAWTFKNIESYGGDASKIFISGHSAGGYLTSMVGMDKQYLAKHDIDANNIAGLIPFSGHTITHFTQRKSMSIEGTQPIIDEMAPLYYVRKDAAPLLLITGDREMEMLGRYEENAYMYRMMKVVGHPDVEIYELDGYGHNMVDPACWPAVRFVSRISKGGGE